MILAIEEFKESGREYIRAVQGADTVQVWITDPAGNKHTLFGSGGGILTAEKLGTTLLGQVPLIAAIREGGDSGEPIVVSAPQSEAANVFRTIAETLLNRLARPSTLGM